MNAYSRPFQSVIPAAIDALVGLTTAAASAANPDVLVKDGMWTSEESAGQLLSIAWPGFMPGYQYPTRSMNEELGQSGVTSSSAQMGLGASVMETFVIKCAALVRIGETLNISKARIQAYANMSIVGQVLGPPWLGGTVMKATMGTEGSLNQVQDRKGLLIVAVFGIECEGIAQQ
jgi:hypothetical protein